MSSPLRQLGWGLWRLFLDAEKESSVSSHFISQALPPVPTAGPLVRHSLLARHQPIQIAGFL